MDSRNTDRKHVIIEFPGLQFLSNRKDSFSYLYSIYSSRWRKIHTFFSITPVSSILKWGNRDVGFTIGIVRT
jgi:hypothetical protein